MLKNTRSCDDDLLDKNQLTYNQIYTFASMTQSTPTINRDNMTNYRMFEYTQNWSTKTSANGRIRNATEFLETPLNEIATK
jgi:hypothetical protein